MKSILIIKNGTCDTDIELIIKTIDQTIETIVIPSQSLTKSIIESKKNKYIGIIILGGYQSLTNRLDPSYQHKYLNDLIEYTKYWIKNEVCVLGICLGAQICAEAIGLKTIKMQHAISGYEKKLDIHNNDEILKNELKNNLNNVLSCHYDCINYTNNHEFSFKMIATYNNIPYIFKINEKVYCVQFHPEITLRIFNQIAKIYPFDNLTKQFILNNEDKVLRTSILFMRNWLDTLNYEK